MRNDSVASTWSCCMGCPTLMLVDLMKPVFLECFGFISQPSCGGDYQGCKAGMFDVSNSLFICSLLYSLVLSVCRGELHPMVYEFQ